MLSVSTRSRHVFPSISRHFRKIACTNPGNIRVRQLEVERKFIVQPATVSCLRSNAGSSRFKKHESLGTQTIHDIYYDRNGLLFSKGLYIRRRNGHWEAKIRTAGDFINSAFTELNDKNAIKEVIEQNLTVSTDGLGIEEILKPCAEFVTERESWMIDGRFRVDVDTTDFGHVVGEVELTRTLRYADEECGEEEREKEINLRREMDGDIRAFMESHPQVFPAGRPLGKLSAYFDWLGSSVWLG